MKESKIVKCSQNEQNYVINMYQNFGWYLLSSQTVDYIDNSFHMQTVGNTTYNWNSKERTNYVTLTFQRDTEMENYEEINKLSIRYSELIDQKKSELNALSIIQNKSKTLLTAGIALVICGALALIFMYLFLEYAAGGRGIVGVIAFMPFIIVGIILTILGGNKVAKAQPEMDKKLEEINKKYDIALLEIENQAKKML